MASLSLLLRALRAALLRDASALSDAPTLDALCARLARVPPSELGYRYARAPRGLPPGVIRSATVASAPWGCVSLFELGAGARMPAHGHPGVVLSAVLCGALRVTAWSPADAGAAAGARRWDDYAGAWECTRNEVARAGSVIVTGAGGRHCVHALRQEGGDPAVLLDILAPPYASDVGVYCAVDAGGGDIFDAAVGSRAALRGAGEAAAAAAAGGGAGSHHSLRYGGAALAMPP